ATRLRVSSHELHDLCTCVRTRLLCRDKPALGCANVTIYWLFFLCIAVMVVTGIAMSRLDWGLSTAMGGYGSTRLLHGLTAYSLLPLVVLHVVMQWFFGRFWAIFKAQLYRSHVRARLVTVAVIVPVIGVIYPWYR